MEKILSNLALCLLNDYCKKYNLNNSDTYLYKEPRKWIFALKKNETNKPICTIELFKNKVPLYKTIWYKSNY